MEIGFIKSKSGVKVGLSEWLKEDKPFGMNKSVKG